MKISVCSDLHLEFGDLDFDNTDGADVLVLSGDILVAKKLKQHDPHGIMEGTHSQRLHEFMQRCSERFKHVVYVVGNHEHYDGDFTYTVDIIKDHLSYLKNIHILERETIEIDGVTFIGSTLWTDMNKSDSLTLFHMRRSMNDFVCISNSERKVYRTVPLYQKDEEGQYVRDERGNYIQCGTKKKEENSKFAPEDAAEEHKKNVEYIHEVVMNVRDKQDPQARVVVVGHHTPSFQSMHPYYAHDTLMNGGYHSNLEDFILDHPEIVLWTHGHVHDDFDYMIGTTRVVCNPRGYVKYEPRALKFKLKTVEI